MTTILISILSGVLGLMLGFTIGIYSSANSAGIKINTIGDWVVGMGSNKTKKLVMFCAQHVNGDKLRLLVKPDGITVKTNFPFDSDCKK